MRPRRKRYIIIYWPWYLRWSIGVLLFVIVAAVGVLVAVYEGLRAGLIAAWESDVWRMIVCMGAAVALGDPDK